MDGRENELLRECIDTGWISSEGPFVEQFERTLAERVQRQHGIGCSSGSAALDLAIAAAEIGPGDEIIMPTLTIISPALSVVRAGGTPVLVDSEPVTWNMDVTQIESKISDRTKAIIVVHLYGLPADIGPIIELAKRHNLILIEDSAEMIGQDYKGRPCGSFGDMSVFSFYANKHVTCGEGGMVVCNDENLAKRCRSFRNLCFQPERRFVHQEMGWNYRLTNLQAAVGLAQLERLDQHTIRKREIGHRYHECLKDVDGIKLSPVKTDDADNVYWVFGLVCDRELGIDADRVTRRLGQEKIGTRPFFYPMHQQPVFLKQGRFTGQSFPVAERLSRDGFYLPSGVGTSDEQVDRVCDMVIDTVREEVG